MGKIKYTKKQRHELYKAIAPGFNALYESKNYMFFMQSGIFRTVVSGMRSVEGVTVSTKNVNEYYFNLSPILNKITIHRCQTCIERLGDFTGEKYARYIKNLVDALPELRLFERSFHEMYWGPHNSTINEMNKIYHTILLFCIEMTKP